MDHRIANVVLRLCIVAAFVPSTWGKIGRVSDFSAKFQIPEWLGFMVVVFEIVGLAALIAAIFIAPTLLTLVAAALLGTVMLGTFFVWDGTMAENIDSARLPVVIIGALLMLAVHTPFRTLRGADRANERPHS